MQNPVKFIDPEGEDIWGINTDGEVVVHIDTDKMDFVYMVDKVGKSIRDKDGNPIFRRFEHGTIQEQEERPVDTGSPSGSYTMFKVIGDEVAQNLFEFLAANVTGKTGVEISHIKSGEEGLFGINYITTSHTPGVEHGQGDVLVKDLYGDSSIREVTHSHKTNPNPSGDITYGDIASASNIYNNILPQSSYEPKFQIYHVPTKDYKSFSPIRLREPRLKQRK